MPLERPASDALPPCTRDPALPGSPLRGALMVLTGSAAWGISGTVAQHLFALGDVTPGWLVTVRMLSAALVLLAWAAGSGDDITAPFRSWRDLLTLLVFAAAGLYAVQLTYMEAIAAQSAPVATILQSLGVVWLTAFVALRTRRLPDRSRLGAILLALGGTALMVTGGDPERLAIHPAGLVWGLLSGVALAFYTAYPRDLMRRCGSSAVIGWAMLAGGVAAAGVHPPWAIQASGLSLRTLALVAFVALVGTALAFRLYLGSLAHLAPQDSALLSTAEPISAGVSARVWLGTALPFGTVAGGLAILLGIVALGRTDTFARAPQMNTKSPPGRTAPTPDGP